MSREYSYIVYMQKNWTSFNSNLLSSQSRTFLYNFCSYTVRFNPRMIAWLVG